MLGFDIVNCTEHELCLYVDYKVHCSLKFDLKKIELTDSLFSEWDFIEYKAGSLGPYRCNILGISLILCMHHKN